MVIGLIGDFGADVLKHVVVERKAAHDRAPILHRPSVVRSALGRLKTGDHVTRTRVQVNKQLDAIQKCFWCTFIVC